MPKIWALLYSKTGQITQFVSTAAKIWLLILSVLCMAGAAASVSSLKKGDPESLRDKCGGRAGGDNGSCGRVRKMVQIVIFMR